MDWTLIIVVAIIVIVVVAVVGLYNGLVTRRNRIDEIRQHEHPRDSRHGFLQQLKTLGRELGVHHRHPGDVSPWSGEAVYEPRSHRVAERDHDRQGQVQPIKSRHGCDRGDGESELSLGSFEKRFR